MEFTLLTPPEFSRTYHYESGFSVKFENVTRFAVGSSGTHRLEYDKGQKAIVAPGWMYITLNVNEWTL